MNTNIKEIKVMMTFCLQNMPEVKTKAEIADTINRLIYEDPEFFGQLTEDNIVQVEEYVIRGTRSPDYE